MKMFKDKQTSQFYIKLVENLDNLEKDEFRLKVRRLYEKKVTGDGTEFLITKADLSNLFYRFQQD